MIDNVAQTSGTRHNLLNGVQVGLSQIMFFVQYNRLGSHMLSYYPIKTNTTATLTSTLACSSPQINMATAASLLPSTHTAKLIPISVNGNQTPNYQLEVDLPVSTFSQLPFTATQTCNQLRVIKFILSTNSVSSYYFGEAVGSKLVFVFAALVVDYKIYNVASFNMFSFTGYQSKNICANFRPAWDISNTLSTCMGITTKTVNRLYFNPTSKIVLSTYYQPGYQRVFASTMYQKLCHPVDDLFSIDAISPNSFIDGDVSNMPFKLSITASNSNGQAFNKFAFTLIFDSNATLEEATCDAYSNTCNIANPSSTPNQTRNNETVHLEFRQSNCAWMETDQMTTMQAIPPDNQNPLRLKYFTITARWTNCKLDYAIPIKSEFLFEVQQNSGKQLIMNEASIIQAFTTPNNPLCAIKGWHLSSLDSTDPLPDSDQVSQRFLQNYRTNAIGDLETDSTKSDQATQQLKFRLVVKQRGVDAYLKVANPYPVVMNVNVGCFKVSTLSPKQAAVNSQNLVSFNQNGLSLVFTQKDLSAGLRIDLNSLVAFTSEYANCGPTKFENFNDVERTQFATSTNSSAYLDDNPQLIAALTPILVLKSNITFPQTAYLRFSLPNQATGNVFQDFFVTVNQCQKEPVPNQNSYSMQLVKGESAKQINVGALFKLDIDYPDICSGSSLLLSSSYPTIATFATTSVSLEGNILTVKAETAGSLQFWVVITATGSGKKAAIEFRAIIGEQKFNFPPHFVDDISNTVIDVSASFDALGQLKEQSIQVIKLPVIEDGEGDSFTFKVDGLIGLDFVLLQRVNDQLVLQFNRTRMKNMISAEFPISITLGDVVSKFTQTYQLKLRVEISNEASNNVLAEDKLLTKVNSSSSANATTSSNSDLKDNNSNQETEGKAADQQKPSNISMQGFNNQTTKIDEKQQANLNGAANNSFQIKRFDPIKGMTLRQPSSPVGKELISEADFQSSWSGWKLLLLKKKKVFDTQNEIPVLKMWLEFTSDQRLIIKFNRPTIIPWFVNQTDTSSTETKSINLLDLNVTRDLFDITLDLHDQTAQEVFNYTVEILSWESKLVQIKFNFTHPLLVSHSPIPDKLYLKFKQKDLFLDEETNLPFESFGIDEFTIIIPKQFPPGIDAIQVEQSVKSSQNGFQALVFISLVAQLILKQSLKKIVDLFVLIQAVVYLNEMSLSIPAQIQILYLEFKKLIEFQTLNLVKIIQLVDPEITLDFILTNVKEQIVSEQQHLDIFEGFVIEIVLFAVAILFVLLVKFVLRCKILTNKLQQLKQRMLWNGLITMLQLGMFRYCLKASEQMKMQMLRSVYLKESKHMCAQVIICLLCIVTLFIYYFLTSRKSKLDQAQVIAKYGNLYGGQKVDNDWQLYRFPVQLTYILVYAVICFLLVDFGGLQVICMIQLHLHYNAFTFNSTVYPKTDDRLLKFCKLLVHFCVLQTVFFTDFVGSEDLQFWFGFVSIGSFGFMVVFYLTFLVKKTITLYLRTKRLKKQQQHLTTDKNSTKDEKPAEKVQVAEEIVSIKNVQKQLKRRNAISSHQILKLQEPIPQIRSLTHKPADDKDALRLKVMPILAYRKLRVRSRAQNNLLRRKAKRKLPEIIEMADETDHQSRSIDEQIDPVEVQTCIAKLKIVIAGTNELISVLPRSGMQLFPNENPLANYLKEEWVNKDIRGYLNPSALQRYTLTKSPLVSKQMIDNELEKIEKTLPEAMEKLKQSEQLEQSPVSKMLFDYNQLLLELEMQQRFIDVMAQDLLIGKK